MGRPRRYPHAHILVMASAGSGNAYIGTPGLTLWVDNMGLVY